MKILLNYLFSGFKWKLFFFLFDAELREEKKVLNIKLNILCICSSAIESSNRTKLCCFEVLGDSYSVDTSRRGDLSFSVV